MVTPAFAGADSWRYMLLVGTKWNVEEVEEGAGGVEEGGEGNIATVPSSDAPHLHSVLGVLWVTCWVDLQVQFITMGLKAAVAFVACPGRGVARFLATDCTRASGFHSACSGE